MRITYTIQDLAAAVGVAWGTLYAAMRRGDLKIWRGGERHPGRGGAGYTPEDLEAVKEWAASRPKKKKYNNENRKVTK